MKPVADSFAWPFRGSRSTWALGIVSVLLLPVLFVPLLGYAVAATRTAEQDPAAGPPPWRVSWRLLSDGLWSTLLIAITWLPFALVWNLLASTLTNTFGSLGAPVIAALVLALPWGLVALLIVPHATASFAASGRPGDLFSWSASFRALRGDPGTWNIVVAAIVTAWAVGIACVGALCVGIVPGIFYAILVSAHATAALHGPRPRSAAG